MSPATRCGAPWIGPARPGYTYFAAPEVEYFYFADDDPSHQPQPLDTGSYFDLSVADVSSNLRRRSVIMLEEMGIPVEHAQHEDARSQHEIDLRYTDALTMADTVMTVRLIVKEIARQEGVHASFMPKPVAGMQGSGMHTHVSLWEGERNAFYDPSDEYGLSPVARQFIAGLLHHAREITAVTNQWVNSYKRLVARLRGPGARRRGPATTARPWSGCRWSSGARPSRPGSSTGPRTAPATRTWPSPWSWRPGSGASSRATSSRPRPATTSSALARRELALKGIEALPTSLNDAVDEMERSELLLDTLGRARLRVVHPQQAGRVERLQVRRQPVRARPLPAHAVTRPSDRPERPRTAVSFRPQRTPADDRPPMDPLLCFPDPFPPGLALPLERAGYQCICVSKGEQADAKESGVSDEGWAGAVVSAHETWAGPSPSAATCGAGRCRSSPLLIVVGPHQIRRPAAARRPLRRLRRPADRGRGGRSPGSSTSSGGPDGGCGPTSSSTGRSSSTWRPTRRRWPGGYST